MSVFTDAQLQAVVNKLHDQDQILYKFAAKYGKLTSWEDVQTAVRSGLAADMFAIGDELSCGYTYDGTAYTWVWCVADHRTVELEDGTTRPGMILQSKYAHPLLIVTSWEAQTEATETTAQDGVYYYGQTGSTVSTSSLTLLNLSAGDNIPYSSYTKIFKCGIRDTSKHILVEGYNRYKFSTNRKWLNSDAGIGTDWFGELDYVGQGKNMEFILANPGFMHGFDEDFLEVVMPTKIASKTNTVTDNGVIDYLYDKFWQPSIEEVYGVPQSGASGAEGPYLPYWKNRSGLTNPSSSNAVGREPKIIGTTNVGQVKLRSPRIDGSNYVWNVGTNGYCGYPYAFSRGVMMPCCVIC